MTRRPPFEKEDPSVCPCSISLLWRSIDRPCAFAEAAVHCPGTADVPVLRLVEWPGGVLASLHRVHTDVQHQPQHVLSPAPWGCAFRARETRAPSRRSYWPRRRFAACTNRRTGSPHRRFCLWRWFYERKKVADAFASSPERFFQVRDVFRVELLLRAAVNVAVCDEIDDGVERDGSLATEF